jgi:hypothetical protein
VLEQVVVHKLLADLLGLAETQEHKHKAATALLTMVVAEAAATGAAQLQLTQVLAAAVDMSAE